MARKSRSGEYAYSRTALIRGREDDGRYAVIQADREHTRVVQRLPDGRAPGAGELVQTADVYDIKPTRVVPTGQRRTVTLPGEFCRGLGIEEGTPLDVIHEDDGRLSIRPLRRIPSESPAAELDDLLNGITPENLHGEIPTGDAVGREAW